MPMRYPVQYTIHIRILLSQIWFRSEPQPEAEKRQPKSEEEMMTTTDRGTSHTKESYAPYPGRLDMGVANTEHRDIGKKRRMKEEQQKPERERKREKKARKLAIEQQRLDWYSNK